MAGANFLPVDYSADGINTWQLVKQLSAAQALLSAAELSMCLRDITAHNEAFDVFPVHCFNSLRCSVWGLGDATDTATVRVYGWDEGGPGHHVATVTCTFGNFTSAATTGFHASPRTHQSIRDAFTPGTAYRGVSTHSDTNVDYDTGITINANEEADFPGKFTLVLSSAQSMQYKFVGFLVTAFTGNGTSLGVIAKPTTLRSQYTSPTGL